MSDASATLLDRLAIDDQLTRYCRAIDTGEWDVLDTIFTPDALLDYTSSGGLRGKFPEIKAWLQQVLPLFAIRQHFVTNREVDVSGDVATSRAYLYNPMGTRSPEGNVTLFFTGGTYHDRWLRTPHGWRITQRIEVEHWRQGR